MPFLAACATPEAPPPPEPDLMSARAFVDSLIASQAQPDLPSIIRFDTADFVWARSGALLTADVLGVLLNGYAWVAGVAGRRTTITEV